jgi:hypothetical protein
LVQPGPEEPRNLFDPTIELAGDFSRTHSCSGSQESLSLALPGLLKRGTYSRGPNRWRAAQESPGERDVTSTVLQRRWRSRRHAGSESGGPSATPFRDPGRQRRQSAEPGALFPQLGKAFLHGLLGALRILRDPECQCVEGGSEKIDELAERCLVALGDPTGQLTLGGGAIWRGRFAAGAKLLAGERGRAHDPGVQIIAAMIQNSSEVLLDSEG